ncbi:MAG: hypothetical protein AABX28_00285 [Nanoarchaeota archaeon]
MVKIEGLFTEEEIKMRDNIRKAQREAYQGDMIFLQLCGKLLRIAEKMFDNLFYDFLWGKSVVGRNDIFKEGRYLSGSYYYTVRIPRYNMTSSVEADMVLVYKLKGYNVGGIYMNVHNPSKNRMTVRHPNNLDDVLRLARAYEEAGLGEFTVKKAYEE